MPLPLSAPPPIRSATIGAAPPATALEARLRVLQSTYESEAQDLREKLAKKKAKLKAAESRIRARISARERKRRTRRLILIGSYMEHVTLDDPERKARLMRELDDFLKRDRDRELFDLPSKGTIHG